jgi:hypothetical protein
MYNIYSFLQNILTKFGQLTDGFLYKFSQLTDGFFSDDNSAAWFPSGFRAVNSLKMRIFADA